MRKTRGADARAVAHRRVVTGRVIAVNAFGGLIIWQASPAGMTGTP